MPMYPPPRLAVVVPCYKEEAVLDETTRRLVALLDRLAAAGDIADDSFILYVNDGSTDRTWPIIQRLHESHPRVNGLNLAANAGHQAALLAGLTAACSRADALVSIDADLQDDPEAIAAMVSAYRGGSDIVYGVRRSRAADSFFKRTTALAFYRLMHTLGAATVYNHADFRLMSRRAVEQLCRYRERNLFLRGIVPLIGYTTTRVYYDRHERFAGESKYPPPPDGELRHRRRHVVLRAPGALRFCAGLHLYPRGTGGVRLRALVVVRRHARKGLGVAVPLRVVRGRLRAHGARRHRRVHR